MGKPVITAEKTGTFIGLYYMIYESDRRIIQEKLNRLHQRACISQYRWVGWGSLATLGWIGIMVRLPPIQQSHTMLPYLIMYSLAYSLSKTVSDGLKKAQETKQSARALSRQLKQVYSDQEYKNIYRAVTDLQRQYPD